MALTTLDAVRTSMQLLDADTSLDGAIESLIPVAEDLIRRRCERDFEQLAGVVEFHDGYFTPEIRLNRTPVSKDAISAVYEDPNGLYGQGENAFAAATRLTAGVDFYLKVDQPDGVTSKCGILVRRNGVWGGTLRRRAGVLATSRGPGEGNIKVVFTGGFATVPASVTEAANKLIARMLAMGPDGFIAQSESFEGRSVSLSLGQAENALFTPDVVSLLAYRKLRV